MFKSNRIIAIDVGSSKVVVAECIISGSSTPVISRYGISQLGVEPDGQTDASPYIVAAIREQMRALGLKPAPLYMAVAGHAVFPRFVKLPPVTKEKILQIIQYEAEQNVPFPIHEVVWDYQLVGESQEGEVNVMLVAVKLENVVGLTDCVQAVDLEPEVVDVVPLALYNTFRFNYPDRTGCTMVLDIGARASNLVFLEGSRVFVRSVPVAGNTITTELMREFGVSFDEAEALKCEHAMVALGGVYAGPEDEIKDRVSRVTRNVITRLHAEINRSINFYRGQQGGSPPLQVMLTGGSSIIPHMDTFFEEKLKVPVERLDPLLRLSVGPDVSPEQARADSHQLATISGLVLRGTLQCPVEVNLLPPALVDRKQFRRRLPFFALAAVGLVLITLCWAAYLFRIHAMLQTRIYKLDSKIAELKSSAEALKKVGERRKIAQLKAEGLIRLIGLRSQWAEMLNAIHLCMCDGMWILSVVPIVDTDGFLKQIEIAGRGFDDKLRKQDLPDATAVEVFRNRLRNNPFFSDETEIKTLPPMRPGSFSRDFVLRAVLKTPIRLTTTPTSSAESPTRKQASAPASARVNNAGDGEE